ncbi:hypothetical protein VPH35_097722 [Triticum aestivum]|uniref:KIB1-4 beta-propeller domain-containing protein n=1 Tax=Triticum aestivum TaxID=4565 RepID=A0A3B6MQA4_WHEAT
MATNTPPFAPAAAAIGQGDAGKGRRGVRSRDGRKRRRVAEESGGWASLPSDMVRLVAARVLVTGDVVDYLVLRSVCSGWRACTPAGRSGSLGTRKQLCLRPRGWVALCDGDAVRPDDARAVTFFKPSTGRRLRVRLPNLRGHRVVAISDGLLVLLHKRTTAVRVLHPFTRAVLDLPPIAPTFRVVAGSRDSLLRMNAAVCMNAPTRDYSIDVVAWFPGTNAVLWAKPSYANWDAIYLDVELQSVLLFRGRLYATTWTSANILQVYPPSKCFPVDTPIPDEFGNPSSCRYFLVESNGRMLLAVRHYVYTANAPSFTAFKIFTVDLDRRQLTPVSSIGDRALILGQDRCLSVSASHFPSISGNSVYCSYYRYSSEFGVQLHSLSSGSTEAPSAWNLLRDDMEMIASARPFTIADHLVTYCNHLEWARGLMFHEYHNILDSFVELKKKIRKQDAELRIPFGDARKKTGKPSTLYSK